MMVVFVILWILFKLKVMGLLVFLELRMWLCRRLWVFDLVLFLLVGLVEGGVFGIWMFGWVLLVEVGGIGGCDLLEDLDLVGVLVVIGGVDFVVGLVGDLLLEWVGELFFLVGMGGIFLDIGWVGFDGFMVFLVDGVGFVGFSGLEGLEGFEC